MQMREIYNNLKIELITVGNQKNCQDINDSSFYYIILSNNNLEGQVYEQAMCWAFDKAFIFKISLVLIIILVLFYLFKLANVLSENDLMSTSEGSSDIAAHKDGNGDNNSDDDGKPSSDKKNGFLSTLSGYLKNPKDLLIASLIGIVAFTATYILIYYFLGISTDLHPKINMSGVVFDFDQNYRILYKGINPSRLSVNQLYPGILDRVELRSALSGYPENTIRKVGEIMRQLATKELTEDYIVENMPKDLIKALNRVLLTVKKKLNS